jgi:hypothetical protein
MKPWMVIDFNTNYQIPLILTTKMMKTLNIDVCLLVTTLYVGIMSTQKGRIFNLAKSKKFQDSQFGILIYIFCHFKPIPTSITNYIIGRKLVKSFLSLSCDLF